MKKVLLSTCLIFIFLPLVAQVEGGEPVTIFYTQNDKKGDRGIVRGDVLSLGAREIADKELRQLAQSKTKVTVRLKDRSGLIPGNTLYIINDKNLIISRFQITTIFKSASFGYLLIGYGNFRRVKKYDKVVQLQEDNSSRYAYIHRARGDYYQKTGDNAQAMLEYEKAVKKGETYAESHIELGYMYLQDGVFEYALREFKEAYRSRDYIYDNEDSFRLFRGMVEIYYHNAYESQLFDPDGIEKNIDSGIAIAREGVSRFPEDSVFYYYLGMFYMNRQSPDDISARDNLLKTVEIDSQNIDAYVALGNLYFRHDNREKALRYTEQALQLDPSHTGAQQLYTRLHQHETAVGQ